jgi:uncharacterized protein YndB with AHSA1/START domain
MPDTNVVTNVVDQTLTITRVLEAPRELVFKAWTEPERFARWAGCDGHSVPLETIEMDVRPGGAFRWTMVNDANGDQAPTTGTYVDIVEPERIVMHWHDVVDVRATVTLTDLGDGRTEMVFEQVGYGTRDLEAGLRDTRAGHAEEIDRLVKYLVEL